MHYVAVYRTESGLPGKHRVRRSLSCTQAELRQEIATAVGVRLEDLLDVEMYSTAEAADMVVAAHYGRA